MNKMDNINFFKYQVHYFDDITAEENNATGVTCGKTMLEAAERVLCYYGDIQTFEFTLYDVEDTAFGVWEDE